MYQIDHSGGIYHWNSHLNALWVPCKGESHALSNTIFLWEQKQDSLLNKSFSLLWNDILSNLMLNYLRKRTLWGFIEQYFAARPDKCGMQIFFFQLENITTRNMNAHKKWQFWKYYTLTHCSAILFIKKLAFSVSLLEMRVWVAFKSEQDPTPTKHLCVFPCCEILWPMQAVLEWCTICQRWSWSKAKCSFNDPAPYILSPVDILLYLGCMKLHSF